MTALFYFSTLILGFLVQMVFHHYLSLWGVAPNVLLLLVLAMGFGLGPLAGESMGFVWGLMSDAAGVHLFGLNAFLLALFGYAAGKLRRRIDGERATPQVVMACLATLLSALLTNGIYSLFDDASGAINIVSLILSILLNGLLSAGVFWTMDLWIHVWKIDREHI